MRFGSKHNELPSLQPFSESLTTKQFAFSLLSNEQMIGSELSANIENPKRHDRLFLAEYEESHRKQLKGLELTRHNSGEKIRAAFDKIKHGAAPIVPWIESHVYNWMT